MSYEGGWAALDEESFDIVPEGVFQISLQLRGLGYNKYQGFYLP